MKFTSRRFFPEHLDLIWSQSDKATQIHFLHKRCNIPVCEASSALSTIQFCNFISFFDDLFALCNS